MDGTRAAPTAGLLSCLALLGVLVLPYGVASVPAVNAYYAAGTLPALATALFAMVGLIVFAAGRQGRSDPALTAGAALVLGTFALVTAAVWAATVRPDVLGTNRAVFADHRWAVAAVAALYPAAAAWYTRALGLV